MRLTRLATATVATAVLALGLAACGSSSDSSTTDESTTTAESTTEDTVAEDTAADTSGGDYCTTAEEVFTTFDPSALTAGDPTALHDVADRFRSVGESAEGDVATAWTNYADYMDLAADIVDDPSKATEMGDAVSEMNDWITTISGSLTDCA